MTSKYRHVDRDYRERRSGYRDEPDADRDRFYDYHKNRLDKGSSSSSSSSSSRRKRSRSRSPVQPERRSPVQTERRSSFKIPKKPRERSRSPDSSPPSRKRKYEGGKHERDDERRDGEESFSKRTKISSSLRKEIKEIVRTENHHIVSKKEDNNGDIDDVEWCYQFINPDLRGHVTGGTAILHHRCRECQDICLHLLGKYGTGKRMCLRCAARENDWSRDEVPAWYFHKSGSCEHCRSAGGGRQYGGFGGYQRYNRY